VERGRFKPKNQEQLGMKGEMDEEAKWDGRKDQKLDRKLTKYK